MATNLKVDKSGLSETNQGADVAISKMCSVSFIIRWNECTSETRIWL